MEIIKLNNKNQAQALKITAGYIKARKTVVFPTDTVYGIICDATKKFAVNKVFEIKQRSRQKFFPVFTKDIKTAKNLARINKEQEIFLRKCWPGKVTIVFKRKPFKLYGLDKATIALRIPDYKPLNLLLKKLDIPLIQTSANISGEKTPKNAKEIIKEFKNKKSQPDLIIDAGKLKNSKQSKMIDSTVSPPKILRD